MPTSRSNPTSHSKPVRRAARPRTRKRRPSRSSAAALAVPATAGVPGADAAPPTGFQSDRQTALGRCARTAAERRATLTEALGRWATEDLRRLERVDEPGRCGWAMWT